MKIYLPKRRICNQIHARKASKINRKLLEKLLELLKYFSIFFGVGIKHGSDLHQPQSVPVQFNKFNSIKSGFNPYKQMFGLTLIHQFN
jgi:hypothetical protein